MYDRTIKRLEQYIRERAIQRAEYQMYTLASGEKSDIYVDMRIITQQSDALKLIGKIMYGMIKDYRIDSIGGPAMGAIPIVTATLGHAASVGDQLDGFYVRSKVKDWGTQKRIEGSIHKDDVVWLFDDVITTGNSLIEAIETVREFGSQVIGVTTLLCRDRQIENTMKMNYGIGFNTLFYLDVLLSR